MIDNNDNIAILICSCSSAASDCNSKCQQSEQYINDTNSTTIVSVFNVHDCITSRCKILWGKPEHFWTILVSVWTETLLVAKLNKWTSSNTLNKQKNNSAIWLALHEFLQKRKVTKPNMVNDG